MERAVRYALVNKKNRMGYELALYMLMKKHTYYAKFASEFVAIGMLLVCHWKQACYKADIAYKRRGNAVRASGVAI